MDVEGGEDFARCFEVRGRVVVARDHDHGRSEAVESGDEVEILPDGALWRVSGVEDVASDDEAIDLVFLDGFEEEG